MRKRLVGGLLCVVAAIAAPAAQASQGSDTDTRGDHIQYVADPGEANQLTVEDTSGGGLHLNDPGAIIRWLSAPVPGLSDCAGGVHDVYCLPTDGFEVEAQLGDGNDTFVNRSSWGAIVNLGPGNDTAVGGGHGYTLDGGPGADDLHGGPFNPSLVGGPVQQNVTYADSPGPVTVTADDVANDGMSGEGDNVHSDVYEVDGSAFGDTISGFRAESGGAGNDTLIGTSGNDTIWGGAGNDVLVGGAGQDQVYDTSGNNTFYARDGETDRIWCGSGYDTVYADPQDVIETPGACDNVQAG
jgi:Ca2+-binding RTX toxin-like protein